MKTSIFVLVTIGVLGILLFAGAARYQGLDSRSALDRVPKFLKEIEQSGFDWQEGEFSYLDTVKEACTGGMNTAVGNNPWPNTYLTLKLDPPEDLDYPDPPWRMLYQLRQDAAIVIIGETPPKAAYFSYYTFSMLGPEENPNDDNHYDRTRVGVPVGDSTNIATINTIGPDRANRPFVYIITGNRETERRVRATALAAGYPAAIINVETISPAIAPLGLGARGSFFGTASRVADPPDEEAKAALEEWVKLTLTPYNPFRAFRVTPVEELDINPYPAPILRVRGTGHTEMDLYPAMKELRKAILDQEAERNPLLPATELGARFWQEKITTGQQMLIDQPYVNLQLDIFDYMGIRDTNYIQTYPYFKLRSNVDEYVMLYGVNHQKTGKATYASVSVYVEPGFVPQREIGLATRLDRTFGSCARQYLPNHPQVDMLYALKLSRHCAENDPCCMQIDPPKQLDIWGEHYECNPKIDLDGADSAELSWKSDLFVIFRAYVEPATKVAPDDNELVWDRAIYFGPYFTAP